RLPQIVAAHGVYLGGQLTLAKTRGQAAGQCVEIAQRQIVLRSIGERVEPGIAQLEPAVLGDQLAVQLVGRKSGDNRQQISKGEPLGIRPQGADGVPAVAFALARDWEHLLIGALRAAKAEAGDEGERSDPLRSGVHGDSPPWPASGLHEVCRAETRVYAAMNRALTGKVAG